VDKPGREEGFLAHNLLHLIRQFYVWGENEVVHGLADQTLNQNERQGFFSSLATARSCGLNLWGRLGNNLLKLGNMPKIWAEIVFPGKVMPSFC
jgi:hypothetical protein